MASNIRQKWPKRPHHIPVACIIWHFANSLLLNSHIGKGGCSRANIFTQVWLSVLTFTSACRILTMCRVGTHSLGLWSLQREFNHGPMLNDQTHIA